MNVTFDFDYYKSIIDYIDTSTTYIDETLQDFVNNYLESRKKTIMPVPVFSSSIEQIQIGGGLKVVPEDNTWSALTDIKIKLFNNDIECDYSRIKNNTVFLVDNVDKLIAELSKTFAELSQINEFEFTYTDEISSSDFKDAQIPSFEWFKNNYYIKNDKTIKFKIFSKKLEQFTDDSIVNIGIGNILSSINKQNKNMYVNVLKSINTNIFSVLDSSFSLSNTDTVVEFSNIKTFLLSDLNSVITDTAISNEVILKNLNNLKQLTVIDSTELNSVISHSAFLAKLGTFKISKQESLKINMDAKNYLTKNNTFTGKYMDYLYKLIQTSDSFESLFKKMYQERNEFFKNRYSEHSTNAATESVNSNLFDYLKYADLTEPNTEKIYTELFIYLITSRRLNKYCDDVLYSFIEPISGIPATLANVNLLVTLFNNMNAGILVSNLEFLNILSNKVSFLDDDNYFFTSPICVNNELPCKAVNINNGINIAAEKTYLF